jgi:hypothetical protein
MDVVALQEKISRIDGVEAARVVAGNGHIDEIHVLARRTKAPKQLVRDVQSLGQALFGLEIDRRIVSVVQLADSVLSSGSRPALADVAESIDGNRIEVTVTSGVSTCTVPSTRLHCACTPSSAAAAAFAPR